MNNVEINLNPEKQKVLTFHDTSLIALMGKDWLETVVAIPGEKTVKIRHYRLSEVEHFYCSPGGKELWLCLKPDSWVRICCDRRRTAEAIWVHLHERLPMIESKKSLSLNMVASFRLSPFYSDRSLDYYSPSNPVFLDEPGEEGPADWDIVQPFESYHQARGWVGETWFIYGHYDDADREYLMEQFLLKDLVLAQYEPAHRRVRLEFEIVNYDDLPEVLEYSLEPKEHDPRKLRRAINVIVPQEMAAKALMKTLNARCPGAVYSINTEN